ncbi:hypothetical protein DW095_11165 [Bacteroides sp. AM07-16]|nr:hypothetical protein DW095_11165 [Bacteroides sp. AM07-16]
MNKLRIITFVTSDNTSIKIKFKSMTKEEREKLIEQKENLKLLFEFHTGNRVIKGDPEFEQYINDILDMIAEIEEKLKSE